MDAHQVPSKWRTAAASPKCRLVPRPPFRPSPVLGEGLPAVSVSNGGEGSSRCRPVKLPLATFQLSVLCLTALGCSKLVDANTLNANSSLSTLRADARREGADSIARVQVALTSGQHTSASLIQRIDLGAVRQGESIRRTIVFENQTLQPITIDRFESSCECLTFKGLPLSIASRTQSRVELVLDLAGESDFHGNLGIVVRLFDGERIKAVFELNVSVSSDVNSGQKSRSESLSDTPRFPFKIVDSCQSFFELASWPPASGPNRDSRGA
jgi:hypothetical protein